jgi:pimeloyl-ACP methyl ester carboxylesterase
MKRKVTIAAITIVSVYLVLCAAIYLFQDTLLFPGAARGSGQPDAVANVEITTLSTADGIEYRVAIGKPSGTPKGVLLHFVGNGEDLRSGVYHAAEFAAYGMKTLVTEYPGYGESGGSPSFTSIMAAADSSGAEAQRWAAKLKVPLFIIGQSLGSFSAVHLVAKGLGDRLLLVSPPTTIAATGQHHYPWLPVGLLLRHPFDNLKNAPSVLIPTLVIHGDADRIVPVEMGKKVAAAITGSKLHIASGSGHNNLGLGWNGPLGSMIRDHFFR